MRVEQVLVPLSAASDKDLMRQAVSGRREVTFPWRSAFLLFPITFPLSCTIDNSG